MTLTTTNDSPETVWTNTHNTTSLGDHLEDLRTVLIKSLVAIFAAFLLCFIFHKPLLQILEHPFELTRPQETFKIISQTATELIIERTGPPLMIFSPLEGIAIALKLSLWGGLALAAPFWGFYILQFILPGLQTHERNMIIPFIGLSLIAILSGAAFGYQIVLPLSNAFLLEFNQSLGINLWSLESALDYSLVLIFAHMAAFELLAILWILTHYRWIGPEHLIPYRKTAIILSLIIGAVLTPPDVLTQVLLAIPLILGYELAILYAYHRQTVR